MDKNPTYPQGTSWPASFRVICVGKEMLEVFRSIISFGFEGVSVQSTAISPHPTPSDKDRMAILLADGYSQQLESIAETFYQAGVLTLIVSSTFIGKLNGQCDAMTVSQIESMPLVVKSLLEPIVKQGRIDYGFNDLRHTLRNAETFKIASSISSGAENRIAELLNILTGLWGDFTQTKTEYLSLIFYQNKDADPPLSMSEFSPLSVYIGKFPENVTVIWALLYDENLSANEIRLDVIAT